LSPAQQSLVGAQALVNLHQIGCCQAPEIEMEQRYSLKDKMKEGSDTET